MGWMEAAQEHHRDACLDNHDEANCVAIQAAAALTAQLRIMVAHAAEETDREPADVLRLHRSEPEADSAPFELPRPPDFPEHSGDMLLMVDAEHYLRPDEVNIAKGYELLAYRWTLYTLDHQLAGVIAWSARPTLPDGFDNLLGIAIHHVTVHGA